MKEEQHSDQDYGVAFFKESALACVVSEGKTQKILHWNTAAEEIFGHKSEEVIGKNLENLLIPQNSYVYGKHAVYMQNFMRGKSARSFGQELSIQALRKDGSLFYAEIRVFNLKNNLVGAIIADRTEAKISQDNLQESNKQNEDLIEELEARNREIYLDAQSSKLKYRRAQIQEVVALGLLASILIIILTIVFLSTFTRIQESVITFAKDALLIMLQIMGSSLAVLYGYEAGKNKKDDNETTIKSNSRKDRKIQTEHSGKQVS